MRKLCLYLILLIGIISSVNAEERWRYELYEKINHENFRKHDIFRQPLNRQNPDIPLINAALVFLTNEERIKDGKKSLDYAPELEISAYHHSQKMAIGNFFSHENPHDRSRANTGDRARLAGIKNPFLAENIAYFSGYSYPNYLSIAEKFIDIWMNSPGHRSNILSSKGLQLGCGVYNKGNKFYATQNFQWYRSIISCSAQDSLPVRTNYDFKPSQKEISPVSTTSKHNLPPLKRSPVKKNKTRRRQHKSIMPSFGFLSIGLGADLTYPYGIPEKQTPFKYRSELLSWQVEPCIGIHYHYSRDFFGFFWRYGSKNQANISKVLEEQEITHVNADTSIDKNVYQEFELGFLWGKAFRLSGGIGHQTFQDSDGLAHELKYYIGTVVLNHHSGWLNWRLGCSYLGGQDLKKAQFRIFAGLSLQIDL